ncbi:MAG: hypothetical protein Q4G04_02960 [bacterium]|nr:hypothetical protein [bacterium]
MVDETSNEIIYSYNETEKEFVVNPDFDQSVFDTPVVSINHKLVNYNYENNQYIITINKLFYVLENDRISNDFYGSYTDAVSRTNVIFSYQSDEDITNEELIDYATNYYNNNYSDLFTKLKQYQYIFIKNNNDYILKEYIIR